MGPMPEKELDIFELKLAIKWAHGASLMDEIPEVSYLFSLCETALKEKLERLKSAQTNDPLTLEELREMDGEPVWVCEPNGTNGVWGLVDLEYQMVRLHGGGLAIWENNDKSWLAYRRRPKEDKHD